jgi:Zn-dependent M28 family amino/carboxypeptidase
MYYRSDHLNFARVGVPALDAGAGVEYVGRSSEWGIKMMDEYTAHHYHKPADTVQADWDMSGAVEDLQLLLGVGLHVANSNTLPEWSPSSEFRALR